MSMNFINSILSGAQNLMFNLQQRPNNVSSLFQPINNPSLQSAQSFIQKQEHNSDSSSKNSEKEDSPSKNKLFNDIPKSEGRSKKKESNHHNNNGNNSNNNNNFGQLMNGNNNGLTNNQLNILQQQMNCNVGNNNNGMGALNNLNNLSNLNIAALQQQQQQQNSLTQNFPSFDISSLQTEEQTKQLLLTKMMINSLLLNNSSLPNQNIQIQNQQQQLQTLLQQQQLIQSLQQTQSTPMLNQNSFMTPPQQTAQLPQAAPVVHNPITPQLTNRYSLSGTEKVVTTENDDSEDENSKFKNQLKKSIRKRQKKINNCGHPDREHYAKGMCSNCYHKYGRTKKPWLCPHEKLYACGLCQNCYINKYNQRKRTENDGPIDGSEKIESDDQQINFSEIDQPDQLNQLTDNERSSKAHKKQLEAQLSQANQQSQQNQKSRQAQQDQAAYGDDEDQGEDDDDEEDDAQ